MKFIELTNKISGKTELINLSLVKQLGPMLTGEIYIIMSNCDQSDYQIYLEDYETVKHSIRFNSLLI